MEVLPGYMLEIVFPMNDRLPLAAIVGRGVATLRNLLREPVYLPLIFHIERDGGIIVEQQDSHHKRAYGYQREMRTAPHPEIGFLYCLAHVR